MKKKIISALLCVSMVATMVAGLRYGAFVFFGRVWRFVTHILNSYSKSDTARNPLNMI